ncbi:site-specific integrase [Candidatus Poribacteria bacterium]|nr:site-specific integrase [Candidatus Poribacteria bacterium]
MDTAGISGIKATAKGLRHSFGIAANQKGIALNMVQRWLGHAEIKTTAIYCEAIGTEERNLAQRLWEDD